MPTNPSVPTNRSVSTNEPGTQLNLAALDGVLSSDVVARRLPSGDHLLQYEVTTRDGDGARSTPVVLFRPAGDEQEPIGAEGDRVAVVGHVRRRFYHAGGATHSRTEVVAKRIVLGADKRRRRALWKFAARELAVATDPPTR